MENVNTSKVTNMEGMFYNCSSLKSLNVLNLSTSNVANMSSMFGGCSNLVSLNLENFNMGTVKRVDKMFKDCSNLTTIYAKKNFLLGNNVQSGDNIQNLWVILFMMRIKWTRPMQNLKVDILVTGFIPVLG